MKYFFADLIHYLCKAVFVWFDIILLFPIPFSEAVVSFTTAITSALSLENNLSCCFVCNIDDLWHKYMTTSSILEINYGVCLIGDLDSELLEIVI